MGALVKRAIIFASSVASTILRLSYENFTKLQITLRPNGPPGYVVLEVVGTCPGQKLQ
jgi:hypothetical protein